MSVDTRFRLTRDNPPPILVRLGSATPCLFQGSHSSPGTPDLKKGEDTLRPPGRRRTDLKLCDGTSCLGFGTLPTRGGVGRRRNDPKVLGRHSQPGSKSLAQRTEKGSQYTGDLTCHVRPYTTRQSGERSVPSPS